MHRRVEGSEAAKVPDDRLLRKGEAAALLACSARTVDRLASLGRLTRVRILGGIRFRLSQVHAIIEGGTL